MKKVGLYVRVSTARQDQEGYSIPLQKERLISYCKAKGWAVAGVFVDPGHSGSTLDRPGLASLISGVEAGRFDAVLVYKLDRLSRSQKDTLFLIEDVFMANGTDFVSLQESFDTTTIYGRAMIGILSVFAQMERETITERTLMGRAGRSEDGLWHGGGTSPIGYDYVDGELVVNAAEAQQVQEVYGLYAAGISVTEISRRMDGFRTKHGGWGHTSTIGNVLDNPLYSGVVHFDGVVAPGKHQAIVSSEINRRVKARRERLRRKEANVDSAYLLTGMVYCSSCGARYFPNKRPNGNVVYSCHSRAKKNRKMVKDPGCKAPHYPVSDLDAMVEADVLRLAADPGLVDDLIKKGAPGGGDSSLGAEAHRLDAEINRLMDLYQHNDLVNVEEVAARIQDAHAKREKLSKPLDAGSRGSVEDFRLLLRDVHHGWSSMDTVGRRALLLQLVERIDTDQSGVLIEWSL